MSRSLLASRGTIVERACAALLKGQPVLLYDADGREEETDMVVASARITPEHVRTLRTEAGGLLCTTVPPEFHQGLGLPYLSDVFHDAGATNPLLSRLSNGVVPYEGKGAKPSFGLTINHRDTFTGVTDEDRAKTIRRLAEMIYAYRPASRQAAIDAFASEFKAPGHVITLNAHPKLLAGRQGHTELSTVLVGIAGLPGSATICEMMNGPNGRALPKDGARAYAERNGLVFLGGRDVIEAASRGK